MTSLAKTNPVRVIDAFVGELDLGDLGFQGVAAAATERPGYHPSVLLKILIYGYLTLPCKNPGSRGPINRSGYENIRLDAPR